VYVSAAGAWACRTSVTEYNTTGSYQLHHELPSGLLFHQIVLLILFYTCTVSHHVSITLEMQMICVLVYESNHGVLGYKSSSDRKLHFFRQTLQISDIGDNGSTEFSAPIKQLNQTTENQ